MKYLKIIIGIVFIGALIFLAFVLFAAPYAIVPLKIIDDLPVVNIEIQGKQLPVVVDLGSSLIDVAMNEKTLGKIGLVKTNEKTGWYSNACGKRMQYDIINIPLLKLGPYNFRSIKGYIYTSSPTCSDTSHDANLQEGVLGLRLWQGLNVIIDYPHQHMLVSKYAIAAEYLQTKWKWIPLDATKSIYKGLIVHAIVGGKPARLLVDSGSTVSTLSAGFVHMKKSAGTLQSFGLIANGHNFGQHSFYLRNEKIPYFDGSIGGNFFAEHVVYLDLQHNRIGVN